jgi:hypothetical protein
MGRAKALKNGGTLKWHCFTELFAHSLPICTEGGDKKFVPTVDFGV